MRSMPKRPLHDYHHRKDLGRLNSLWIDQEPMDVSPAFIAVHPDYEHMYTANEQDYPIVKKFRKSHVCY